LILARLIFRQCFAMISRKLCDNNSLPEALPQAAAAAAVRRIKRVAALIVSEI
jgi:hypothetical protein